MEMGHITDFKCAISVQGLAKGEQRELYKPYMIHCLFQAIYSCLHSNVWLLLLLRILLGLKQTLLRFLFLLQSGCFCDLFDPTEVAFVSAQNSLNRAHFCKKTSQTGPPITAKQLLDQLGFYCIDMS